MPEFASTLAGMAKFDAVDEARKARKDATKALGGRVAIRDLFGVMGLADNRSKAILGPIIRNLGIRPIEHGRAPGGHRIKTVTEDEARMILHRYFELRQMEAE